jgi:hypothetical protein
MYMRNLGYFIFSILSSLSITLTAPNLNAQNAKGPGTSGGGDTVIAEFVYLAEQVITALKSQGEIRIDGKIFDLKILEENLQDLIARDGISTTPTQPYLNGQPKDLVNDWAAKTLLIYRQAWENSSLDQKQLIIIHELLGLARIPDEFYQTSRPLFRLLAQQASGHVSRSVVQPVDRPTRIEAPIDFSGTYVLQSREGNFGASIPNATFRGYNLNPKDEYNHVDGNHLCLPDARPVISVQIRQRENMLGFNYRIYCATQAAGVIAMSGGSAQGQSDLLISHDQRLMYMGVEIGWISGDSIFINAASRFRITRQSGDNFRFSMIDEDGPRSGRERSLVADIIRVNQP